MGSVIKCNIRGNRKFLEKKMAGQGMRRAVLAEGGKEWKARQMEGRDR